MYTIPSVSDQKSNVAKKTNWFDVFDLNKDTQGKKKKKNEMKRRGRGGGFFFAVSFIPSIYKFYILQASLTENGFVRILFRQKMWKKRGGEGGGGGGRLVG